MLRSRKNGRRQNCRLTRWREIIEGRASAPLRLPTSRPDLDEMIAGVATTPNEQQHEQQRDRHRGSFALSLPVSLILAFMAMMLWLMDA